MLQELDEGCSLEAYVGDLSTKDMIEMFLSKVGKEGLVCVEKLGLTSLRVYFRDSVHVNQFLEKPVIVKDREVYFLRVGEKLKTIFVKGLPFNLPEVLLYEAIKKYGKLRSIGYERYAGYKPLCTGTRILKMKLQSAIPNFLPVGKFIAVISYKNQVKVCRRCGGNNHFAKECNTQRDDFKQGFPIHTRPVAVKSSNKSANAQVQTQLSGLNSAVASGPSLNSTIQASGSKSNVSFTSIAQRFNGLRLEGRNRSSDNSASSLPQAEISISSHERFKKNGKKNVNKCLQEVSCPVECSQTLGVSVEAAAKVVTESTGATGAVSNATEENHSGTAGSKKKKKKKKKKSNK